MSLNHVLCGCIVVMLTTHFWAFLPEIRRYIHDLKVFFLCRVDPATSRNRLEEAFAEATVQQYMYASTCWAHSAALLLPVVALQLLCTGTTTFDAYHMFVIMVAWAFHGAIAAELIPLSLNRIRVLQLGSAALLMFFSAEDEHGQSNAAIAALQTAARFANSLCCGDVKTTIVTQLLISILELWRSDPSAVYDTVFVQVDVSLIIVCVAALVEFTTRSRIAMLIDSETLVMSFRRMLPGLCDGELLLDSDLNIIKEPKAADCLKKLLMTRHDSSGAFEEILAEEDRLPFRHFIAQVDPTAATASTPRCLRVSLQRGKVRVRVDLFHVKVPHLSGAHHLLACREDSESRLRQEVDNDTLGLGDAQVPSGAFGFAQQAQRCPSARSPKARSVCSETALEVCKELQEMTLLIDANTPLLDVEQAHMSFLRDSGAGTPSTPSTPSSTPSSMPSLRRIVQPTDWGRVRDELVEFAERQYGRHGMADTQDADARGVLKMKLRLRDKSSKTVEARRVEVSPFAMGGKPTMKLHVHLSCLRLPKMESCSKLPDVYEYSESETSE